MRPLFMLIISIMAISQGKAQGKNGQAYDPKADAMAEIDSAIKLATTSGKNVLVQVGGNWCPWCTKLDKFIQSSPIVDSLIASDFVVLHVNYSKENKNMPAMARLEYPQRFGFPVLVILSSDGKRLHTQDSGLLEDGEGSYDEAKLVHMLKNWNPWAIDPARYK